MEKNGSSGVYQCTFPAEDAGSGIVNPEYYEQP